MIATGTAWYQVSKHFGKGKFQMHSAVCLLRKEGCIHEMNSSLLRLLWVRCLTTLLVGLFIITIDSKSSSLLDINDVPTVCSTMTQVTAYRYECYNK